MNDREGKTTSYLAISEKKPQSVGGCKCIFFQMFDWKKRLAKKKLFSKKLLPAVRSKQFSKKFGGDDKQPKLRLIADENCGGLPNVKKVDADKKHETRSLSLVAKLMGLDYMPNMQKSKSRKSYCVNGSSRTEKIVHECKKVERKELILERVDARNEWRPQKFQKTGFPERRQVVKLGADQLQIQTVLSRSGKHQLPNLCSPVKSPKSSGRNASRLIDAASRILEPGLQKSRGRHALTYSSSSCRSNYDSTMDERTDSPPEVKSSSSYHTVTDSMNPKGHYRCTNCDLTLDRFGFVSTSVEKSSESVSPVSHYVDFCCQKYETSHQGKKLSYHGMENKKVESQFGSASQLNTLKRSCNPAASRKLLNTLTSQQSNSQKDLIQRTQVQNQMLQMKDGNQVKSKLSSIQGDQLSGAARDIGDTIRVAPIGKSFSGHAGDSERGIVDECKYVSDRESRISRRDAMHPGQKKRPTNFVKKFESLGHSSDLSRQTRTGSEVISEREARFKSVSLNCRQNETSLTRRGYQRRTGSFVKKTNDMDSFMSRSSTKYIAQSNSEMEYSRVQMNSSLEKTCEDGQSTGLPKPISMSGDALSTLLEQKLQELTSQGEDDSEKSGNAPKKTTAMILQELISALTTEQHYHNHSVGQSNSELDPCYNHHCLLSADTSFRFKAQNTSPPTSVGHENDDIQRLSLGSVLGASIAIDSSLPSDHGDVSSKNVSIPQNKRVFESARCINGERRTREPNADLLEPTVSQRLQTSRQVENKLLNNVTDILDRISVTTETSLIGNKLNHAKGVILDAELMLANEGFNIIPSLFMVLETLAGIIRMSFSYTRAWNQLKLFTFDSLVEYLDSRYTHYSNCGFSVWSRLPLHIDIEMVTLEIVEEIRRWTKLAGMLPDDLIDWDMSHSLGKWTNFEAEAFDLGIELDQLILESLVEELVNDICT